MKLRIVSITLILSLFFVPMAQAGTQYFHSYPGPSSGYYPWHRPIYRPVFRPIFSYGYSTRPRYYGYRNYNNNDILIGLGAAILLGSIFSNTNSSSGYSRGSSTAYNESRSDLEYRERQKIENSIKNKAENEAKRASSLVAERGIGEAINILTNLWKSEGRRTSFEDRSGIAVIKIDGFNDGSQITYSFYPENRKVFVKISVPEYSVSEEASEYYADPLRNTVPSYAQQPTLPQKMPNNPSPILSLTQYTGFEIVDGKRSASGHMLIGDVAKGTAAFYAGLRQGDRLVRVDVYDTFNHDFGWIKAYIAGKSQSRALLKITFLQNGVEKTADIQL